MTLPPLNEYSPTGQSHENDIARTVLVCAPSALSKMMGSLHPAGALYEKPVNTRKALDAHAAFVMMMKKHGVNVLDVRDVLIDRVAWSVGDRVALENLAFGCLTYLFDRSNPLSSSSVDNDDSNSDKKQNEKHGDDESGSKDKEKFPEAEAYYISDQYKRSVIEHMGEQQLVDIIFTNPTVTVTPSPRDTGFTASYAFHPLSNIVFVRDQQITTRRGIVMARLRSPQRARETDILLFCLRKLGLHVIGRVPVPGYLEGGDFFPAGDKLSLLGLGMRTDHKAAEYLLSNDLFGTETVALVKDDLEKRQERMHLDTVFNIIAPDCCLMLADMMGADSPTRRVVDEYVRDKSKQSSTSFSSFPSQDGGSHNSQDGTPRNSQDKMPRSSQDDAPRNSQDDAPRIGKYHLHRGGIEFSQYMKEKGYRIIPVSSEEQLKYGCNVLNLGNGHVVSIERNVARRIACSPYFHGTVQLLDFRDVTCMYGGVHCASQVVRRDETLSEASTTNGSVITHRHIVKDA